MYKLYAKTNEQNVITQILTEAFVKDPDNWHEIGEQESRHYHEPIQNNHGIYLYEVVNGEKVLRETVDAETNASIEACAKKDKINDKDNESRALLTNGYDIEPGATMSTSVEAQIKWNALINAINLGYEPDYPYPISLVDGDVYYVNDVNELLQIFVDAFVAKNILYVQKLNERKYIVDGE